VDPFPDDLGRFLDANVETFEQLEILRLLGEDPQKEWGVADLGREVQAAPQAVAAHLTALQGRGLLQTVTRGADRFCRHGPATAELEGLLSRLLQVYRERPVTTIKRVYARARTALQSFADAFRIRKED
jgi:DNA-binding MarR family transcriptional regulator